MILSIRSSKPSSKPTGLANVVPHWRKQLTSSYSGSAKPRDARVTTDSALRSATHDGYDGSAARGTNTGSLVQGGRNTSIHRSSPSFHGIGRNADERQRQISFGVGNY